MDTKGLQKEFLNWCKSKNKSPKTEDETKQLFVAFMKEKHPEEYKQAVQNQQKQQQAQTKKAAHGAKLNYFKSLKNQCPEGEELYYFKKGGKAGCGCKKKEDGGQVTTAKEDSAIAKFKATRKMQAGKKIEQKKEGWDNKRNYIVTKAGIEERKKQLEANKNKEGEADPNKKPIPQKPKSQQNPQPKLQLKQPTKKECGGAVAKFKKHYQGGKIQFSF